VTGRDAVSIAFEEQLLLRQSGYADDTATENMKFSNVFAN